LEKRKYFNYNLLVTFAILIHYVLQLKVVFSIYISFANGRSSEAQKGSMPQINKSIQDLQKREENYDNSI